MKNATGRLSLLSLVVFVITVFVAQDVGAVAPKLATRSHHTLAVKSDGTLWGWGWNW